jgi:uncharacterized membrane protein
VIGIREGRQQILGRGAGMSLVPIYRAPYGKGRRIMPLIHLLFVLAVVGVLLWLVNAYLPVNAKIKKILNIVVVIAVALWLLSVFGILGSLSRIRVGR